MTAHDALPRVVLTRFALAEATLSLRALGNAGGFSGASLWQVHGATESWCLRAWPAERTILSLEQMHRWLADLEGARLPFIPRLRRTPQGGTWVQEGGRFWEVTTWLPGVADFQQTPTPERLRLACRALAQVHQCWQTAQILPGPCPAVQRRLEVLRNWESRLQSAWTPSHLALTSSPFSPWIERAWPRLFPAVQEDLALLAPWKERAVPLQPCLCDVWHDHLLFVGNELTGLIDYGAMKIDHVAVDLARMLGSLIEDEEHAWRIGLTAYRAVRPLTADEETLARLLDRGNSVVGILTWLHRLLVEQRRYPDEHAVARRLAVLVSRLERRSSKVHICTPVQQGGTMIRVPF